MWTWNGCSTSITTKNRREGEGFCNIQSGPSIWGALLSCGTWLLNWLARLKSSIYLNKIVWISIPFLAMSAVCGAQWKRRRRIEVISRVGWKSLMPEASKYLDGFRMTSWYRDRVATRAPFSSTRLRVRERPSKETENCSRHHLPFQYLYWENCFHQIFPLRTWGKSLLEMAQNTTSPNSLPSVEQLQEDWKTMFQKTLPKAAISKSPAQVYYISLL